MNTQLIELRKLAEAYFFYRDGNLYWKTSQGAAKAGAIAGSVISNGYRAVFLNRKSYRVHRLIFLMQKGYLPSHVDHIDLDKLNNKIENLRAASQSENGCNRPKGKLNTSGFKGVTTLPNGAGFSAKIVKNKKTYWLGSFKDPEHAHLAYIEASKKYHGEFSHV